MKIIRIIYVANIVLAVSKKKRGRPRGSKNKPKVSNTVVSETVTQDTITSESVVSEAGTSETDVSQVISAPTPPVDDGVEEEENAESIEDVSYCHIKSHFYITIVQVVKQMSEVHLTGREECTVYYYPTGRKFPLEFKFH